MGRDSAQGDIETSCSVITCLQHRVSFFMKRPCVFKEQLLMHEYSIQTSVSGRYLIRSPLHSGSAPLFVGFHGYAQTAEDELTLLCDIPGSELWLCCSIEALHPVYTSKGGFGASWMTSQYRDKRISENVHYVDAVIQQVKELFPVTDRLCFHGFSQGCGMACRAAILGSHSPSRLMMLGGDIPPELSMTMRVEEVHLARGDHDRFYTREQFERDFARSNKVGVPCTGCLFTGDHGANKEYLSMAGDFLAKA